MPPKDIMVQKESFLKENRQFTEVELDEETRPVGKIEDIDISENEVWLLQCPKGMDVKKQLEDQRLKIPGRTNLDDSEAVSVEFIDGKEQHAFAYCNRKCNYSLRLLPVRGTIVLRNRLKAAETITPERIEECCPPSKKVPMPSTIRVRHPLLGFQYKEKLNLDKEVVSRLNQADKISAEILRKSIVQKMKDRTKTSTNTDMMNDNIKIEIIGSDSEEEIAKAKKLKRVRSESGNADDHRQDKKKKRKSKKNSEGDVSKDLQWIVDI